MAKNKKNISRKRRREGGYNKMRARTDRINTGVRLALCGLALTACVAFLASALPHQKKLDQLRLDLDEVLVDEQAAIERKDAKERELGAIKDDSDYLEIIARDRLNYYKPGEHIFRIER